MKSKKTKQKSKSKLISDAELPNFLRKLRNILGVDASLLVHLTTKGVSIGMIDLTSDEEESEEGSIKITPQSILKSNPYKEAKAERSKQNYQRYIQ